MRSRGVGGGSARGREGRRDGRTWLSTSACGAAGDHVASGVDLEHRAASRQSLVFGWLVGSGQFSAVGARCGL